MGSPVSTRAVAADISASANHFPAAFDGMTDVMSQVAGTPASFHATNEQSHGTENFPAGFVMYGDKPDTAPTGGIGRPHDEEKANTHTTNAASKERFSQDPCENWEETSLRPFGAYLKYIALWLVFAVVMWLFLPLFFCLVSFQKIAVV